jgi:hydrogenase nickel incorporation protein HypA/HybF
MHELSIAMNIVEIAEQASERNGGVRIAAVRLRLGLLSGVVKEALLFSYGVACEDTPLAGSRLIVEEVPGEVYCPACNARRLIRSSEWYCCSQCGSAAEEIVQGKEVEIVSLEVEE